MVYFLPFNYIALKYNYNQSLRLPVSYIWDFRFKYQGSEFKPSEYTKLSERQELCHLCLLTCLSRTRIIWTWSACMHLIFIKQCLKCWQTRQSKGCFTILLINVETLTLKANYCNNNLRLSYNKHICQIRSRAHDLATINDIVVRLVFLTKRWRHWSCSLLHNHRRN